MFSRGDVTTWNRPDPHRSETNKGVEKGPFGKLT